MPETLLRAWLMGLGLLTLFLYFFSKIAGYQGLLIIAGCFVALAVVRTFGGELPDALQGTAQIALAGVAVVYMIQLWQHVKPLG